MSQPAEIVRAGSEVRGTQSFVHVMASMFKRPSLTVIEIFWRSIAWLPATFLPADMLGSMGMDLHLKNPPFHAQSFEELQQIFSLAIVHHAFIFGTTWSVIPIMLAITAFWGIASAFGRTVILRRIDPALTPQRITVSLLSVLRLWALTLVCAVWLAALILLYRTMVMEPASRGEYPSYVAGFALMTVVTLLLFMLWCVTSWIFPLATTLAMTQKLSFGASVRAALRSGKLRSKLMEINLVMGIVKVCLVVLAMVFSACPLPFEAVATQEFMVRWTIGVLVLWIVASDYFHVVRAAAVLALTRAYEIG